MSVIDCLREKARAGRISEDEFNELRDLVDEMERELGETLSPDQARTQAAREAQRVVEAEAARKKRLANLQIVATHRIENNMRAHPKGLATGAITHLVRDIGDRAAWSNVDSRHRTILGQAHARWADGLKELKPRGGVVPQVRKTENMVRELFNEDSGDGVAKTVAKQWADTAEYLRKRFNAAGGQIAKREDWGLPQMHDQNKVMQVSKQEWINFIWPKLDRSKMVDFETGRPLSDARLADLLDQTYERIRTNGLIDVTPGAAGKRKLANRHADHRFLTFRSADDWLAYQRQFGREDVYTTMVNHIDTMAKDIALLEVLGPNPDAMVRRMTDTIRREAALNNERAPGGRIKLIEDTFAVLTDRVHSPHNEPVARFMSGMRNLLTSAQLGGAFLSATTDLGFQKIAREHNGLPTMNLVRQQLRFMNPLNVEDQKFAVQAGLIAENWSSMALAQQRFLGEIQGPRITKAISDLTMRASLLSPWTQAGRWAFGAEFLGFLGRNTDKTFRELPEPLQRSMKRYAIGPDTWDTIRKAPVKRHRGADFVWSHNIAQQPGGLEAANRLQQMVLTEQEFAVPSVDARTRAIMTQGTRPGGLIGEITRSIALYKSFPVTVIATHLMRGVSQETPLARGRYLANMFITMTVLGAFAYQAKQIQRGKDPVNMNPENDQGRRFWMSAMMQGGGLGIFGDFLLADVNRFGRGPAMTFAGPVAEFGDNVARLTVGNVQELALGEDTQIGREIIDFAGRYMPGGSLWYGRAAFERLVLDQLQQFVDPKARDDFRRMQNFAQREYGQRYFWRPGETTPHRAPNLEAAIEE
jgi:hypothetical protein